MSDFKVWECLICGYVYDEAIGEPGEGIQAGTRWEDVPEDWLCPECGVGKADFEMIERPVAQAEQNQVETSQTQSQSTIIDMTGTAFQIWECLICGWQYDESKGLPEEGFPAGTLWQDIPEDWLCPECGVGKSDFEMVAIATAAPIENLTLENQSAIDYALEPIVIVGTGLAGYTLAKQFRRINNTRPVIMVTSDDGAFYSKPALSTGYQKNKSALGLVAKEAEVMAAELELDLRIYCNIEQIDTTAKTINIDNEVVHYHKLVLALGSQCINPPISGNASQQVLNINNLTDYARFRTAAVGKKRLTIIGAGLIGSEFCNDMALSGFEIDIVDPLPHMLASLIPQAAAARLQQAYSDLPINFHFGCTVDAVDRYQNMFQVTLSNGETICSDLVLSAVGVRANVELAKQHNLDVNRGIVTNNFCQTSANDVYALGDCAEVSGQLLFYIAPLNICAEALASTLDGTPTAVNYGVMPVTIKTSAHQVLVVPPVKGVAGNWHIDQDDVKGVSARFIDESGKVIGFTLTGDKTTQKDAYIDLCQ